MEDRMHGGDMPPFEATTSGIYGGLWPPFEVKEKSSVCINIDLHLISFAQRKVE